MSKVGLPYLPSNQVWTNISSDKYCPVYPTYLSKSLDILEKFAPKFIFSWNILGYNEDTYHQEALQIKTLINDDFK